MFDWMLELYYKWLMRERKTAMPRSKDGLYYQIVIDENLYFAGWALNMKWLGYVPTPYQSRAYTFHDRDEANKVVKQIRKSPLRNAWVKVIAERNT